MKKFFQYAFAAVIAVSAFTSCSDDDDPVVPGANIEDKSYTATDGLNLVVNGEPLVGKTVTFTKGADDNATIKLTGEGFDLNSIMGQIGTKAEIQQPGLTVPTCGVIPGSPEYEFQVKLIGTGDECVFEGGEETEYCTFKYSGKVTKDALDFNITDLKLKNTSLVGNWKFPEFNPWGDVMSTAVTWDAEAIPTIDFMGFPMQIPIQGVVGMAMAMEIVPDPLDPTNKISPNEVLTKLLKNVEFREDGNIVAEYTDLETEDLNPVKSPIGIAQYVITEEGKFLLFLNPQQIVATTISNATKALGTRAPEITTVIEQLLSQLLPLIKNGIPLEWAQYYYTDSMSDEIIPIENTFSFTIGKEVLLPLLRTITPVLSDPEVKSQLVELAKEDMGEMAASLEGILDALPDIVKTTSEIKLGINLEKQK